MAAPERRLGLLAPLCLYLVEGSLDAPAKKACLGSLQIPPPASGPSMAGSYSISAVSDAWEFHNGPELRHSIAASAGPLVVRPAFTTDIYITSESTKPMQSSMELLTADNDGYVLGYCT